MIDGGPNVVVGSNSAAVNTTQTTIVGSNSIATEKHSTLIGSGIRSGGAGNTIAGTGSFSPYSNVNILGTYSTAGHYSTAIGACVNTTCNPASGAITSTTANAVGDASVAIGSMSQTPATNAVAIGYQCRSHWLPMP